jgi:hypothetical protein
VYEPDTPVKAEERLGQLMAALEVNEQALKDAYDEEMAAEEARDAAQRRALLSDECPAVGVFGGRRTTVAMQEAWVADRIAGEEHAYRLAVQVRRAADAQRRRIEHQLRGAQSINRNASDAAYRAGGRYS